jgi:hypothetical protein
MKSLLRSVGRRAPRLQEFVGKQLKRPMMRYRYQHRMGDLPVKAAYAKGQRAEDAALIARLVRSHKTRQETPTDIWLKIYSDHHQDIIAILNSDDGTKIQELFRDPVTSDLLFGFDSLAKSLRAARRIEDRHMPRLVFDAFVTLAEAIKARRVEWPENYRIGMRNKFEAEVVLSQIDTAIGFKFPIPNPYPAEYGLVTDRGIASFRVPQALYQAWRISQLVSGRTNPRILEIGGGLGRTAYYARQFGVLDYTIVDIPISSLAQGYFLGRTVGEDQVALVGEAGTPSQIKLISPSTFLNDTSRYDLIVNIDSLTEVGRKAADQYWQAIQARSDIFFSVNHEANEFTVADLIGSTPARRAPYWLRRGYVEEIVERVGVVGQDAGAEPALAGQ